MNLYILIQDDGDGSFYPKFVADDEVMDEIKQLVEEDLWNCENGAGCDGDGFHYTTLKIPDGSTAESIGLHANAFFSKKDLKQWKIDNL